VEADLMGGAVQVGNQTQRRRTTGRHARGSIAEADNTLSDKLDP
jgi:hypothetical protein